MPSSGGDSIKVAVRVRPFNQVSSFQSPADRSRALRPALYIKCVFLQIFASGQQLQHIPVNTICNGQTVRGLFREMQLFLL